ncbi:aldo/keto reductase [Halioxenophilus aromaticivorans]|uniref:Aldo/keto reductase n=1 Tax=Halioxenophilus aromaticivorans TaxID=1306992 RepID=A0AAV3U8T1_9ALTE
MKTKRLGNSGLFVSEMCLGTMTFGGSEGLWGMIGQLRQPEANTLVHTALDQGINFIDTANVYAQGASEEILGAAIKSAPVAREDVVLATKSGGVMGSSPNARGASRGHIYQQVHASLKRLNTDYIDLYQIHAFDPATPMEETLHALHDLVQQGHLRYVGLSNWAAWQIMKAVGITQARQLMPITSLQAYYTIAGRDLEREVAPMLQSEGLGLMVWSPLAGGFLSGKYDRTGKAQDGRRQNFDFPPVNKEKAYNIIEVMQGIAASKDCSVAQVALAWLLHQPVVTSVIVGAKRQDQLLDNIGAANIALSAEELVQLDTVGALPAEYPGWMLKRQGEYRDHFLQTQ